MGTVVVLNTTKNVILTQSQRAPVVTVETDAVVTALAQNAPLVLVKQSSAIPVTIGVPGLQGAPGASGNATVMMLSGVNGDVVTLIEGQPVMVTTNGTLVLATSGALTSQYVGLCYSVSVAPGGPLLVMQSGTITQATTSWNAVTGNVGGLAPGMPYFLQANGAISFTVPTTGECVLVGVAVSSTTMQVRLGAPITL